MARSKLRVPLLLFVGMILMQSAWILTLPPFRGLDEFDHAYRAAAVAGGEWMPDYVAASNGRGELVVVPRAIVQAAEPECSSYEYTGHDNCHPVQDLGDGKVTVLSSAARYNPVFYWMIGTPAKAFDGAQSLYVMRIVGAVLCSLFVALAGWTVTLWAQTRWPLVALLIALTPVAVYSTAVAAPNGIEMAAALGLWTALLGLTRPRTVPRIERLLLYAAIPCAVVLTTVRSMGPLWLALIVLSAIAMLGIKKTVQLVRRQRLVITMATTIIAVATIASVWWIRASGANSLSGDGTGSYTHPLINSLKQLPLWFLQSIAAFPSRGEQAPAVVYATETVLILGFLGIAIWSANRRYGAAIAGILLVAVAVPFILTLMTYSQVSGIWQGRYGLPYSFGLLLAASLALERSGFRHRLQGPLLMIAWVAAMVAHTVGAIQVLVTERASGPSSGGSSWIMPQPWVVAALVVLGGLCWAAATLQPARSLDAEPPRSPTMRSRESMSQREMLAAGPS